MFSRSSLSQRLSNLVASQQYHHHYESDNALSDSGDVDGSSTMDEYGSLPFVPKNLSNKLYSSSAGNTGMDKKINELESFDACVEVVDSLAANSSMLNGSLSTSNNNGKSTTMATSDRFVRVSPDGILLHVPHGLILTNSHDPNVNGNRSHNQHAAACTSEMLNASLADELECESDCGSGIPAAAGCDAFSALNEDINVSYFDQKRQEIEKNPRKLNAETGLLTAQRMSRNRRSMSTRSAVDQMSDEENDLNCSVVVGKDDIGGDKEANGFSYIGVEPVCVSHQIRVAVDALGLISGFTQNLVDARRKAAEALLKNVQSKLGDDAIRQSARNADDVLNSKGGHWLANPLLLRSSNVDKNDPSSIWKEANMGPMLQPGSSLREGLDAIGFYFSKLAATELDRCNQQDAEISGSVNKALEKSCERAGKRERALYEVHCSVEKAEKKLEKFKEDAVKKWKAVADAENEVDKRMERKKRELQLKQAELKKDLWELVNQDHVLRDLEASSFSMINSSAYPDLAGADIDVDSLLPPRSSLEEYCNVPVLRLAAINADHVVEDAASDLLNALSAVDTTKRSAHIAAESCLLSAGMAQAKYLKSIVMSEKAALEQRLKDIESVEQIIDNIDVRDDMNSCSEHARDGNQNKDSGHEGIASALAVLNCQSSENNMDESFTRENYDTSNEGNRWSEENEIGIVSREEIGILLKQLFEADQSAQLTVKETDDLESTVLFLEAALKQKSVEARAHRASVCYALNNQRSINTMLKGKASFDALGRILWALLDGCGRTNSDIANAKMCMMLAETFYMEQDGKCVESPSSPSSPRSQRVFVKRKIMRHQLWSDEDFWDQALYQCVTEALSRCRILRNISDASRDKQGQNKEDGLLAEKKSTRWHDLKPEQRVEAASQLHSVIFSQLAALAHSMTEFGCGKDRAAAFVRRLSVRSQLPISMRALLLEHINNRKVQSTNGRDEFDDDTAHSTESAPLVANDIAVPVVETFFDNIDAQKAMNSLPREVDHI